MFVCDTNLVFFYRKYENGAVGSLTHVVALQGTNYSCELEVFADGYQLKWVARLTSKFLPTYDRADL